MKLSLAFTVLVLAVAATFGWRNQQRLSVVRTQYDQTAGEARQLGISPETPDPSHTASSERKDRPDRQTDIKALTNDLIASAKRAEAMRSEGLSLSADYMRETMALMDRMGSLDRRSAETLLANLRDAAELSEESRKNVIEFCLQTLAENRPETVLTIVTSDPENRKFVSNTFMILALRTWAKQDPAGAVRWFNENKTKYPDIATEKNGLQIISAIRLKDPGLAFAMSSELGINQPEEVVRMVSNNLRTADERDTALEKGREFLGSITDPEARRKAAGALGWNLAESAVREGFEAGSAWLEKANFTEDELVTAPIALHQVRSADTGRWIEWFGSKTSPSERSDSMLHSVVISWTNEDYQAVGEWLNTTPPGRVREKAVAYYAQTIMEHEPETAARWAETLPAGKDRDGTIMMIYRTWPATDEKGKAAFAEKHGFK